MTVCLLEAGPSDVGDDNILVLSEWMHLLDSGYDWDYPVEPQERGNSFMRHARGEGARRLLVAQLVHRVPAARRMPGRVGDDGRRRLERRRGPAADRRVSSRPCCCATCRRKIPAATAVLEAAAMVGHADRRVQSRRDRPQRRRLVPDQRRRGRHQDVQLACVSASDPGVQAQSRGAHRLLGGRDPLRRVAFRHRCPLPAAGSHRATTPSRRGARSSSPQARSTRRSC